MGTNYQITVAFVVTLERIMCKQKDWETPFSISYSDVQGFLKRRLNDKQTTKDKI